MCASHIFRQISYNNLKCIEKEEDKGRLPSNYKYTNKLFLRTKIKKKRKEEKRRENSSITKK